MGRTTEGPRLISVIPFLQFSLAAIVEDRMTGVTVIAGGGAGGA